MNLVRKSPDKIQREAESRLRRLCARRLLFRIPGEGKVGDWRTLKAPYTFENANALRAKYPAVIIANEDIPGQALVWTFITDVAAGSAN